MKPGQHFLICALEMKRTRIRPVEEALAANHCIIPECCGELDRRGLCRQHANEFYADLNRQPSAEAKAAFEQKMIHEGLVLERYGQKTRRRQSVFSKAMKAS